MANRIKGITVEIGGDTTKLDKALAGTNKQLYQTQGALKDVEKLLKLDPGNTELLAQKQRLLGDAVEGTKSKLDMLRQAAESANSALQRGSDYDAKYQPLKEKLDEVSASLRGLQANAQEMQRRLNDGEISTEAYNAYIKKLHESKQAQDALKKSIKDLEAEFAGAKMDRGQYDALQRELIQTKNDLDSLKKEAKSCGSSLESFGDKVKGVSDSAGKVQDIFSPVTKVIAGLGAAAIATVPATEDLRTNLSILDNNARMAGVGIDAARQAFDQFNVVSGEVDSSVEATANLLQAGFTESNLQIAVDGLTGAYLKFPETLKIESLADSLQETLATGKATGQFGELLDRLGVGAENFSEQMSTIPDAADRINVALSILHGTGMMEFYEGWKENNGVLYESKEAVNDFQQSMADLAETIQPVLTEFTELATSILNWFNALPDGAKVAIAGIGALLAVVSPIAGLISSITWALAGASIASAQFSIVGNAVFITLGKWVLIIGLVVAAVLALVAAFSLLTGKSKEVEEIEVPDTRGGFNSSWVKQRSLLSDTDLTEGLPHLAKGGVARRNNPQLVVVGDNQQEDEIISPYSTIKRAAAEGFAEAAGRTAGRQATHVDLILDGVVCGRLMVPHINAEYARLGVKTVTR